MAYMHYLNPDSMAAYYAEQQFDDDNEGDEPELKVCNHCGATELHWQDAGHGWRLFNANNDMHLCDFKPADLSNLKAKL